MPLKLIALLETEESSPSVALLHKNESLTFHIDLNLFFPLLPSRVDGIISSQGDVVWTPLQRRRKTPFLLSPISHFLSFFTPFYSSFAEKFLVRHFSFFPSHFFQNLSGKIFNAIPLYQSGVREGVAWEKVLYDLIDAKWPCDVYRASAAILIWLGINPTLDCPLNWTEGRASYQIQFQNIPFPIFSTRKKCSSSFFPSWPQLVAPPSFFFGWWAFLGLLPLFLLSLPNNSVWWDR